MEYQNSFYNLLEIVLILKILNSTPFGRKIRKLMPKNLLKLHCTTMGQLILDRKGVFNNLSEKRVLEYYFFFQHVTMTAVDHLALP